MSKDGILIIISGFSGAGKGTVVKKLIEKYNYAFSISSTTRSPRNYEQDGREYFFVTREKFDTMIEDNALIEWAEYVGNYYGTPRDYVESKLKNGEDTILEIETQGAFLVKKQYPQALLIFIATPSIHELKNRLVGRGTEDEDKINSRIIKACEEVDLMEKYDYIVVNDNLDDCVEAIHSIVTNEHSKASRNLDLITNLKQEFCEILKGEI